MNLETIFTVKNEDLDRLNPQDAVGFFCELIWAEATALGIGKNLIKVSSAINVKDGGIDAEVKDSPKSGSQGLIKKGLTRYQIKSGKFSLSDYYIKKILFKDSKSIQLKPRIKSCLDKNGTLIVVLFGWDAPESEDNQIINRFIEQMKRVNPKYESAKIEIFQQNNLRGFLKTFPSLALKVTYREKFKFQTHRSWSQNAEMLRKFKSGPSQNKLILNIHNELRKNDEAIHIRVMGEAGIGKTRIALEATRIEDLEPLVIYCDNARDFKNSNLFYEILKDDNQYSVILIIDECDKESIFHIWDKLKYRGPRIKLISIYGDLENISKENFYEVPPLGKEKISSIIQEYGIPKDQADRWVEYCGGSPRVAHVFGYNLKNNPEDLLKTPDTVNVWSRYIAGLNDPKSEEVIQYQLVLQHIALFKRFGFIKPLNKEAKAVWKKISDVDPHITWSKFHEIINKLKRRKILQGEYTLYITSKALHVYLWSEWWKNYGSAFDVEEFCKDLPPKLLEWFFDMFKYAAESQIAAMLVKKYLRKDGLFQTSNLLETNLGGGFFTALTEANPEAALECLKNKIGTWTKNRLLNFTRGRRTVIWALEKMAMWKDLFKDAARLLLALGEAENETYSNNASGVFIDLFSPAPRPVAPTEASPQERFPILKEAIESNSKKKRLLAIDACKKALESQHFHRIIGDESFGLRKGPQLWMPRTYGEIFESYRMVLKLLREKLDELPSDEQEKAIEVILDRAGALSFINNLTDIIIDTVKELIEKPFVNKKIVLEAVIRILRHMKSDMREDLREKWMNIRNKLEGSDFSSLMNRYVGMDILEDKIDAKGDHVDMAEVKIKELVQKVIKNRGLIKPELPWLVTKEAKNGYRFGYELAKKDENFSFLPTILEVQRKSGKDSSLFFISGYIHMIFENDVAKWENLLDSLTKDDKLSSSIPELTWRSGMTNRAAQRILKLAQDNMIDIESLGIFSYGGSFADISENIFNKWIEFLLRSSKISAVVIALELFFFYYVHYSSIHKIPKQLSIKLLIHQSLFKKVDIKTQRGIDDYEWTEIAKLFTKHYPDKSNEIVRVIFKNFGKDETILYRFHSYIEDFLEEIAKKHPIEIWKIIKKYLAKLTDLRAYAIKSWMQRFNFLSFLPPIEIWKWVDEDAEKRALYLARLVSTTFFREKGKVCLARELLVRYGERKNVRASLSANFSTEFWSGPASLHYQKKKERLVRFRQDENNDKVLCWLDKYISQIDSMIVRANIEEERNDF